MLMDTAIVAREKDLVNVEDTLKLQLYIRPLTSHSQFQQNGADHRFTAP